MVFSCHNLNFTLWAINKTSIQTLNIVTSDDLNDLQYQICKGMSIFTEQNKQKKGSNKSSVLPLNYNKHIYSLANNYFHKDNFNSLLYMLILIHYTTLILTTLIKLSLLFALSTWEANREAAVWTVSDWVVLVSVSTCSCETKDGGGKRLKKE